MLMSVARYPDPKSHISKLCHTGSQLNVKWLFPLSLFPFLLPGMRAGRVELLLCDPCGRKMSTDGGRADTAGP